MLAQRFCQIFVLFIGSLIGFSACTNLPKDGGPLTDAELIQNLPASSRERILNLALRNYTRSRDSEVDAYLSSIAARVTQKKQLSLENKIKAILISSPAKGEGHFVWPLPPDRVLFEKKLLRTLEFENEIAAAIAFSWELTQESSFQQRFLAEVDLAEPNLRNIYRFSEAESMKAVETSIDLLYVSRYDPRGLVSYFEKLRQLNRGNSTLISDRLVRLQDKARRTIAYYPPLMSPTIRTQEFYRIRKRLEPL